MRYLTATAASYVGVDLHARTLFVCVLDQAGTVRFSRNLPAKPEPFLSAIAPFRPDLLVACECMHSWYWLADTCRRENIPFALGHAFGIEAVHTSKTKTLTSALLPSRHERDTGTPGTHVTRLASEPATLISREVGYKRASGQAGDRSPVQPPVLSGTVPEEPDTCLVQPPTSSLASVHRGMIATADSSERFVPNLLMPCLC